MQALNVMISDRIKTIKETVFNAAVSSNRKFEDIQIMAVTKTVAPEVINIAIENGIQLLGENRVQEYLEKHEFYNTACDNIHFIGHLQTNKVKYIIDKVGMIQSVSSTNLAIEIDKRSQFAKKSMDILVEVNIANEASKSGFSDQEALDAILLISSYKNINIRGLMCIPPKENVELYFGKMNELFCKIKAQNIERVSMDFLSMGMSGDYEQAIRHNSNIIRLGSALFGERNIGG
ncbi:MAG: YggS family pyridoxal phosphate-dependent enzyme [Oscillospiraceae bacterium]